MGSNHFYTENPGVVTSAIKQGDYHLEGIACYVVYISRAGSIPLYHLSDPNSGNHLYTTDEAEAQNAIVNNGYRDKVTACYVNDIRSGQGIPLYRLFNG